MVMEAGLDTGPMLLRDRVPIGPKTTATDLHDALAAMGARLVVDALDGFADGRLRPEPQPKEGVTYAAQIGKEAGRNDWQGAARADRPVRPLKPWPGARLDRKDGV